MSSMLIWRCAKVYGNRYTHAPHNCFNQSLLNHFFSRSKFSCTSTTWSTLVIWWTTKSSIQCSHVPNSTNWWTINAIGKIVICTASSSVCCNRIKHSSSPAPMSTGFRLPTSNSVPIWLRLWRHTANGLPAQTMMNDCRVAMRQCLPGTFIWHKLVWIQFGCVSYTIMCVHCKKPSTPVTSTIHHDRWWTSSSAIGPMNSHRFDHIMIHPRIPSILPWIVWASIMKAVAAVSFDTIVRWPQHNVDGCWCIRVVWHISMKDYLPPKAHDTLWCHSLIHKW